MQYYSYDIGSGTDLVQRNPYWIALVFPYKYHQTFDLNKIGTKAPPESKTSNQSSSSNVGDSSTKNGDSESEKKDTSGGKKSALKPLSAEKFRKAFSGKLSLMGSVDEKKLKAEYMRLMNLENFPNQKKSKNSLSTLTETTSGTTYVDGIPTIHVSGANWVSPSSASASPVISEDTKFNLEKSSGEFDLDLMLQVATPIILTSDILDFQVTGSMESPTGVLSLGLAASFAPITMILGPEDWIVFWAFEDRDKYDFVLNSLNAGLDSLEGTQATQFEHAPKFAGQISAISQTEQVDAIGNINLSYNLVAYSFSYLLTRQYFNETLNKLGPEVSRWWAKFNSFIPEKAQNVAGRVDVQEALYRLIIILYGVGLGEGFLTDAEKVGRLPSPNTRYRIPEGIYSLFTGKVKDSPTIVDLSYFWFGIQKYSSARAPNVSYYFTGNESSTNLDAVTIEKEKPFSIFVPSNFLTTPIVPEFPNMFETNAPLLGQAFLGPLMFNNQTGVDILRGYLAEPVNEMYSALKVQLDGKVYPTTIFRQNPKCLLTNSPETYGQKEITYFKELPAWYIPASMIKRKTLSISGNSRINYAQITPINWFAGDKGINPANVSLTQPITDTADILRNGLNPMIFTIPLLWISNETAGDRDNKNSFFNKLMASIAFNGHLKFSGEVILEGTQLPIAHGDCCEIDGIKYYIESVTHNGGIDPNGVKMFATKLVLSDGVIVNKETGEVTFPNMAFVRHSIVKEE